jgi:hypothetical protein
LVEHPHVDEIEVQQFADISMARNHMNLLVDGATYAQEMGR